MNYDLAPMEGITTYIYRSTFEKYYGGVSRYYTPFLASMHLSTREKNEVLPEHNEGMTLIPQILSNRSDEFLEITKALQAYGYDTVNLNLGLYNGELKLWMPVRNGRFQTPGRRFSCRSGRSGRISGGNI